MQPLISTLSSIAARQFGNEIAVSEPRGESLSFLQIDELAARFAGGLRALGIGRGDRVVLHLPNGWRWVAAYYAVARLGGVVVPANILLSAAEVAHAAIDSGATVLIVAGDTYAAINAALSGAKHGISASIVTGSPASREVLTYEQLLQSPPAGIENVGPDDLLAICYTSGTTGTPKGAMLSHRNVFMSTALTATLHVRQQGEVVVSALPLPHVYGTFVMNAAFLAGMRLVVIERFDAGLALETIQETRATLFEGVPTMYYYMLVHPSLAHADLSSLTRCTVGGQTMPTAKIDAVVQAFGCPLLELWGMTEVAGPAISHSTYVPARHGSIGLPFPMMDARIVDVADGERQLGPGEAGELQVHGPLVTAGYWRNEASTRETLTADGWLRTGDIARRDADGYLYIVDRKKDMIITAGYNIYPAELEQVIATHPAVSMVAVSATSDEVKGELAKAFVVLRENANATEQEIIEYCRAHLAAYKVPRSVAFLDDLPKTSTGKILRRALRTTT